MPPIEFDPQTQTFLLSTPSTGYAVRVATDRVGHLHWGERLTLAQASTLPLRRSARGDEIVGEELPYLGGARFGPPAIIVEFADGVRALDLAYDDHDIRVAVATGSTAAGIGSHGDGNTLRIGLIDRHFPLRVDLYYRVYADSDVIERWCAIEHSGSESTGDQVTGDQDPIAIDRLDSAAWTLPHRPDYRVSHTSGEWSAEFALERAPLPFGETTSTSRRGATRHQVNPWLAIDPGDAGEEFGEVWTLALAWSGGFHLTAARTLGGLVTVSGGAEADRRHLQPGERFTTPVLAGAYSRHGFGSASRTLHRYALDHVLPHPDELPAVLYNSWEATWFEVTEKNQIELARHAAALGVELYVMDDGWFGDRVDDTAGLGDWRPSLMKFPNGLTPLAEEVHRLRMKFGIWVEPEMVNPDSDLYRAHPDWVLHMTNRSRTEQRNQLVLNFARPDVVQWAYDWLDDLVATAGVDFLKWDMNRAFTEAGWPGAADPGRLWIDHTIGVYDVIDRLRAAHPHLRIESCASGGGRADFGIMRRTDQVWTSDNADPVDRLPIQDGYSQVYPAITMGAWVTASPNPVTGRTTPLAFRMHSAMAGALGISGDLRDWPDAEQAEAIELIAAYKRIRPLIAHGDLHRIAPGIVEYAAADRSEAAVLIRRPSHRYGEADGPVRLRGLDPDAIYTEIDGRSADGAAAGSEAASSDAGSSRHCSNRHSGAVLMAYGLEVESRLPRGDYASALIHLRQV